MRKILVLALFLCIPLAVFAQDAAQFNAETAHYRVFSETSQAQAEDVSHRMEAALALYNDVFHFDLSQLPTKFRVRVFKDLDSFNAYLDKILSQKRTDFVFIAWSDPERSELLAFPKDEPAVHRFPPPPGVHPVHQGICRQPARMAAGRRGDLPRRRRMGSRLGGLHCSSRISAGWRV